jgi:RNA polymerase sigma-70 factor (ECF subfamily)
VRWKLRHPEVTLEAEEGEESPMENMADAAPNAGKQMETRERGQAVRKAIADLPPDLRTAVLLFEYEGLSHAEIAAVEGCSAKAIETRLYRARLTLEQTLAHLM